ncbi:DEDDh family exonuclease [Saccharothrix violaceirubra]|uniref:DNA polymerase-3 subunit epsilon n=1 Tax=Saccharothrix violaceirubra TaxID=413306 RepID=A0A7W7TA57_9PSEU|nr:exonuclease domain-containing protein [Saccharothrix violaceirubra]MBB4969340.1 DNA polymerase-3 subunit epsilon [Saccharothrix violaceirubra]
MGYAVVDVETTGFTRLDRVIEIAVVRLDDAGRVTDEWCTLLNPGRDLGPQHVHRISAADVWDAPTFEQAAGAVAERLEGHVLVAHNLAFDARFLRTEFARLGTDLDVDGLCTMRLASRFLPGARSLEACCAAAGVPLGSAHEALADARATASLLAYYLRRGPLGGVTVPWPRMPSDVAEVRRGQGRLTRESVSVTLTPGDLVVFTGRMREDREVWVDRACAAGLRVNHGYVTRTTSVVVAADPFSLSTKARRARQYGVPIVSEDDFAALLHAAGPEELV